VIASFVSSGVAGLLSSSNLILTTLLLIDGRVFFSRKSGSRIFVKRLSLSVLPEYSNSISPTSKLAKVLIQYVFYLSAIAADMNNPDTSIR